MTEQEKAPGLFAELRRRNVFRVGAVYTIASWLIIQIVDVMFPALQLPDWTVTLVAALIIVGLPIALVLAWAFELTPDGIKRETQVDRSQSITDRTGRRLNQLIIGVLTVAVVYFAFDKFVLQEAGTDPVAQGASAKVSGDPAAAEQETAGAEPLSIAVLPFADLSKAGDSEYFADGLSEELLNVLAKLQVFKVAGRTSSFSFKGKNEDLRTIGEQLGVANILEGSVRRSGDQIRVTAQLINVADGFHLWSESYDYDLDNIFNVQDAIAAEVVKALKVQLIGEDEIRSALNTTRNGEAYTAFLTATQLARQSSFRALEQSAESFRRAIALDPDYDAAYAGLAQVLAHSADAGNVTVRAAVEEGRAAARRALTLRPDLSEGYAALGMLHFIERNYDEANAAFEEALDRNPNAVETLLAYGRFLVDTGKGEQGIRLLERARDIDPLHMLIGWEVAEYYRSVGAADAALEVYAQMRAVAPRNPMGFYGAAYAYIQKGQLAEAIGWFEQSRQVDPDDPELLAEQIRLLVSIGSAQLADAFIGTVQTMAPDSVNTAYAKAIYLHVTSGNEAAVKVAREAIAAGTDDRFYQKAALLRFIRDAAIRQRSQSEMLRLIDDYRRIYPHLAQATIRFEFAAEADIAADFAWLLINAGKTELGEQVANESRNWFAASDQSVWTSKRIVNEAKLAAALGEQTRALNALRDAFDDGLRHLWQFVLDDSVFDAIRNDWRFEALIGEIEQDLASQRQSLSEKKGRTDLLQKSRRFSLIDCNYAARHCRHAAQT